MTELPPDSPVPSRLDRFEASDPHDRADDPWSEFRSIEVLQQTLTYSYHHSLGKYSRFFQELENRRLMATKCPSCETVWMPPRPVCPRDLGTNQWTELPGTGTLAGHTVIHRVPQAALWLPSPFVLAYVDLDGADTLFLHVLDVGGDPSRVEQGMDIHVAFKEGPVDHPIWLIGLEPGHLPHKATDTKQEDVIKDEEVMD